MMPLYGGDKLKILSKLKLLFTPTDELDAVNKKYVDDLVSSGGSSQSTCYGSISLEKDNSIAFTVDGLDAEKINIHTLLILKSDTSSSLSDNYTGQVAINASPTTFSIVDKYGNHLTYHDIINGGTIVLGFNGHNFVLLNKPYLLDSYTSNSTDYGATANSLKTVYDHFTDVIGDIPEVLDSINRKAV